MKYIIYSFSSIILVFVIQSCSSIGIRGNGKIIEDEITISDYNEIAAEGIGQIIYEQKESADPYFRIATDENIYPLLIISSDNGELSIRNKEDIDPTKLEIHTNSTKLSKLSMSGDMTANLKGKIESPMLVLDIAGAGNIISDSLTCNKIVADIAGASSIKLAGRTTYLECDIAGAGKINTFELVADSVICDAAGMGNFMVYAEKYLKIDLSGMGSVKYKGQPTIDKSISGMGKITDAN